MFSTAIAPPVLSATFCITMRAALSTALPAAKGTINLMGLLGYAACAAAGVVPTLAPRATRLWVAVINSQ